MVIRRLREQHRYLFWVASFVIFTPIAILLLSRGFSTALSHDEYQFVASGQFIASKGLLPYRDFPFLHMPYMSFIYALVFKLTSYDMLAARLLNEFILFCTAVSLFYIIKRLVSHRSVIYRLITGTVAIIVFVTNPVFINVDGRALNHAFPTLMSLLAWIEMDQYLREQNPTRTLILSGLAIGLAIGTRLTYAVLLIPFLGAILLAPNSISLKTRFRMEGIFIIGLMVGLLPVFILFVLSPWHFYYGNYVYIHLNEYYRKEINFITMTYLDKLQYFINEIMSNAVSILLYMCSLLAGGIAFLRWVKNKDMKDFEILFIACIALVLFMSAFGPTPSWPQYIFAPLPFIIILMIIGLEKYHLRGFDLKPVAGVILLIAWLGGGSISKLITDFQSLGVPSLWQPVMMHQYSLQLKENLSTTKGKVLTLAPAFPLEGGLDAYEMFAVGPFSWRTAQFLTSEKRQKFGIIAAEDLDTYLKDNFPQAILTGLETNYDGFMVGDNQQIERPLIQYALQNGYIPHDIQPGFIPNQTTLWIRP